MRRGATLGKSYRRVAKKNCVDWRKKIASTGEKNCVDWRVAGETPALRAARWGGENQMVMNMILIYVGGQYKLVLAAQYLFRKLHPNLMGLFRRDLSRLKGLYQVTAQVRALVDSMAAGPGKFDIRSFGGATEGGYQQLSVRLGWVADIVDGSFQR